MTPEKEPTPPPKIKKNWEQLHFEGTDIRKEGEKNQEKTLEKLIIRRFKPVRRRGTN